MNRDIETAFVLFVKTFPFPNTIRTQIDCNNCVSSNEIRILPSPSIYSYTKLTSHL